jgi:hypothetical protein
VVVEVDYEHNDTFLKTIDHLLLSTSQQTSNSVREFISFIKRAHLSKLLLSTRPTKQVYVAFEAQPQLHDRLCLLAHRA